MDVLPPETGMPLITPADRAAGLMLLERAEGRFAALGAPSPLGTVLFSVRASAMGIEHRNGEWGVAVGIVLMGYACRAAERAPTLPAAVVAAIECDLPMTAGGDVDYDALCDTPDDLRALVDHTTSLAEQPASITALTGSREEVWETFEAAAVARLRGHFLRRGSALSSMPVEDDARHLLRLGYALRVIDEIADERPAGRAAPSAVAGWQAGHQGEELDLARWFGGALALCVEDFAPLAERLLESGAPAVLGIGVETALPSGDAESLAAGSARFGYALRGFEFLRLADARQNRPADPLAREVVALGPDVEGIPALVADVVRYGYCGGAEALLRVMPGAPAAIRTAALDVWTDRFGSLGALDGRQAFSLAVYGYLTHRACELRPDLLLAPAERWCVVPGVRRGDVGD